MNTTVLTAPYPAVHVGSDPATSCSNASARTVLDAGCGPASFMRHLFKDALDLYGFDLTAEMVDEGKRIFRELGRDPKRMWLGSVLEPAALSRPAQDIGFLTATTRLFAWV